MTESLDEYTPVLNILAGENLAGEKTYYVFDMASERLLGWSVSYEVAQMIFDYYKEHPEGVVNIPDLLGIAPDVTGDMSSEAFVRQMRDEEWGEAGEDGPAST